MCVFISSSYYTDMKDANDAYESMNAQNTRLLQQLTEKDDAAGALAAEKLRLQQQLEATRDALASAQARGGGGRGPGSGRVWVVPPEGGVRGEGPGGHSGTTSAHDWRRTKRRGHRRGRRIPGHTPGGARTYSSQAGGPWRQACLRDAPARSFPRSSPLLPPQADAARLGAEQAEASAAREAAAKDAARLAADLAAVRMGCPGLGSGACIALVCVETRELFALGGEEAIGGAGERGCCRSAVVSAVCEMAGWG
jgi:hypothetical protein